MDFVTSISEMTLLQNPYFNKEIENFVEKKVKIWDQRQKIYNVTTYC